jgi:flagellar hook-length control protein FliK
MPAAVSNVSASVSSATSSRAPAAPADQSDSQSFQGELDRAQNQGSTSQVDGQDPQPTASSLNVNQNSRQTQAQTPGKTGSPKKGVGKTRVRLGDKADSVLAKGRTAKIPSNTDPESDAASSDDGNGEQKEAATDHKSPKKSAVDAAADSAAAAPNQAGVTTANVPDTQATSADKKARNDLATGRPITQQMDDPTAPPDGTNADDSPTPDASLQLTSGLGSRTARSSKGRSANATEDNGDSQIDSTPNLAASIQSIAAQSDAGDSDSNAAVDPAISETTTPVSKVGTRSIDDASLSGLNQNAPTNPQVSDATINSANNATQTSPEAQFADANRSKIVSGITGKLLPDGGSMQLTLDPANLGPMQVRVEMKNGVMSASFETSNDQASKLLSHSLGDLKSALEAQGVTVEKLHVSQSSKQQPSSGDSRQGSSDAGQNRAAQQEQQRKDMMQRMWRRLMKGQDPLDLVA